MLTEPILDGRAWTRRTVGEEFSWTAQLPPGWLDTAGQLASRHEKNPGQPIATLIEVGHQKAGRPLTRRQLRALQVLERFLRLPEFRVEFRLRPGQVLLTNNHWILHNRTAFEDSAFPRERRHYIRLWISRRSRPDPGC